MALTKEQIDNYIRRCGIRCLYCESTALEFVSNWELDGSVVKRDVSCEDCQADWTDVYEMSHAIEGYPPIPKPTELENAEATLKEIAHMAANPFTEFGCKSNVDLIRHLDKIMELANKGLKEIK